MSILSFLIGLFLGAATAILLLVMHYSKRLAALQVSEGQLQSLLVAARNEAATAREIGERRLADQKAAADQRLADEQQRHADQLGRERQQAETYRHDQEERFQQQLDAAKESMKLAAQQLMEHNAERLKAQNAESVGQATSPLREAISEMRKAMGDASVAQAKEQATLRDIIERMMKSNELIGQQAESLTNVLRRDNKAAGNMGEVILGDLLAAQGLVEGVHYEVQPRLRDSAGRAQRNADTGREMQPDVILHYPEGQDVVIDSKVSLTAYERYVNAQTDDERAVALREHIASVRRHVNELAAKDYSRYIDKPRRAVDFVILFMPFESSLQLALANDATLWHEAFERKVFVTSEQNLTAILHMISVAWVQYQQAENQQRVFGLAEVLLDRLGDFIQRYNAVGTALEQLTKKYDEAGKKLSTGKQSVVQKAREIIDLGAKENPNRRIPEPEPELLAPAATSEPLPEAEPAD